MGAIALAALVCGTGQVASGASSPRDPSSTCFQQTAGRDRAFIVSSHFPHITGGIDAAGVDDFVLAEQCTIRSVVAVGVYGGRATADAAIVTFYRDGPAGPGVRLVRLHDLPVTSQGGRLTISLERQAVTLPAGTYWVSVQAVMDYFRGQWAWALTTNVQGAQALWKNPGDGWRTGCTRFTAVAACLDIAAPQDFVFMLSSRAPVEPRTS